MTTVSLNGAMLQMEIDTGTALTLISETTFSELWPRGNSPHLESTSIHLQTYSGEELKVVGRVVGVGSRWRWRIWDWWWLVVACLVGIGWVG